MKINKDKFNDLWNDVYNKLQMFPGEAEKYYLSGCV